MKLCPAGCGRNAKPGHLMCGPCWSLVPKPLQAEVWRTWDNLRVARNRGAYRLLSAEYRKAADAATAAAR